MKKVYSFILTSALAYSCISCGILIDSATYYARRAKVNMNKAIQHGATVNNDTVFNKLKLTAPGVKVQFEPVVLRSHEVIHLTKDSVVVRLQKVAGPPGAPDTVKVEADCPDVVIEKEVATSVNSTIECPKAVIKWWWLIVATLIGAVITKVIR